ncbi:type II CAAX endopeptidase family protein [Bacillus sp. PK3_68]|uniref:CPBP family intramembrane glutamic endopeptidase n=1 Tax=Bacillus sp. PK3_68 TaxID=2027408 RepID=UPI000E7242D8|nr:type II CAAX endopeptidase family protein [Bacillus sp. PK3_68]RJS59111.1 CPBP family intramembrane metalloprotease [Bacillus sp. PK3_68]
MNEKPLFFKYSPWKRKETLQLLLLVFVIVPFFIEYLLNDYLESTFQNDLYAGTLTGFIMSIVFTLAVYCLALRPQRLTWKEVGLSSFPKTYWGAIGGWAMVLIIASIFLIIAGDLFGLGYGNKKTDSLQSHLNFINFTIGFISAAVTSPVYEEILYRGFLYRWLRSKYGLVIGMIGSSFIFMLVHIPTYNVLPITFISGLVFSWTYEKTKSIIPGMIIHAIFNALAVILTVI